MPGRTAQDTARRLFTRKCLACGYDGSMLRAGQADRCARCGCDLRERPARSYAEMEGLMGKPAALRDDDDPVLSPRRSHTAVLIERWLWFCFLALILIFTIATLALTAVPG